jgi:carbon-monoxide dehydrogenase small subunit
MRADAGQQNETRYYPLTLTINGAVKTAAVRAGATLLEALRDTFGHVEVKNGCEIGECGACAILLDGTAVNACLVLALQAAGKAVVTVSGLGTAEAMHPLQERFLALGAAQCGYCIPGMLIAARALLDVNPHPSRQEIRRAIAGNLCRCTGYTKIIDAIASVGMRGGRSGGVEEGDKERERGNEPGQSDWAGSAAPGCAR